MEMASSAARPQSDPASLGEIELAVRRAKRSGFAVLSPGEARIVDLLVDFFFLGAFAATVVASAPLWGRKPTDLISVEAATQFAACGMATLMVLYAASIFRFRIPIFWMGGSPGGRLMGVLGPYATTEILAASFYAHVLAARAAEADGRRAKRLIRRSSAYLFCPSPIIWNSATSPESLQTTTRLARPAQRYSLFGFAARGDTNLLADAWHHLEALSHRLPPSEAVAFERLTLAWCRVAYSFCLYERAEQPNALGGLREQLTAIINGVREVAKRIPDTTVQYRPLRELREMWVALGGIAMIWLGVGLVWRFGSLSPAATVVPAIVGTVAIGFAAWGVYGARIRAEDPARGAERPPKAQTAEISTKDGGDQPAP
jgi:hypothetical protein